MIPSNIKNIHILSAIKEIKENGVPSSRKSKKFSLLYRNKAYPPKYILSVANTYANGEELDPESYEGGRETNTFLRRLGFTIKKNIDLSRTPQKRASSKIRKKQGQRKHNERCPECKTAVLSMLEKIYGSVGERKKFRISTDVESYKGLLIYKQLKKIRKKLEKNRGFKNFVRAKILPVCDYYIPKDNMLVEFDESQHFTKPRELALRNYPSDLKTNFSVNRWISMCKNINAKDNDPPFRDEQRAWYDTLRDFLPEIAGTSPTVRLFSKDIKWCDLNPNNKKDVELFKRLLEGKAPKLKSWIAAVILQSDAAYTNRERLNAFKIVLNEIKTETDGNGVILFPGGWFSAKSRKAKTIYNWVEQNTTSSLKLRGRNIIACVGIDGRETDRWARDQIGMAISKKGTVAIGRKFHPAPTEKQYVKLAKDYQTTEEGKSRVFELNKKRFFICACYDSFGIKHRKLPDLGIDVVLDLVHGFYPKGQGNSGDVYFAKNGFAGTSKYWNCPVYGAAVFFNRKIPMKWPSGVFWNQRNISTKKWKYKYNPLMPVSEFNLKIKEGLALVRLYAN